ncbi:hypothetical protein KCP69_10085 [Salmonella enterica subsp. enterica]|nr:hypothetical protein KCP69_10085 [Salmonella enterica subsp. enterica]
MPIQKRIAELMKSVTSACASRRLCSFFSPGGNDRHGCDYSTMILASIKTGF